MPPSRKSHPANIDHAAWEFGVDDDAAAAEAQLLGAVGTASLQQDASQREEDVAAASKEPRRGITLKQLFVLLLVATTLGLALRRTWQYQTGAAQRQQYVPAPRSAAAEDDESELGLELGALALERDGVSVADEGSGAPATSDVAQYVFLHAPIPEDD